MVSGSGAIEIGGTDHAVSAGSVVYVPAHVPHHFHSVTENLPALVIFPPEVARDRGVDRLNIPAGTKWEREIAYSRAVRAGPFVAVSQTSSIGPDVSSPAEPTRISRPYMRFGTWKRHSVTPARRCGAWCGREFTERISRTGPQWLARTAELFGKIKPAITMLTCTMVSPEILVEEILVEFEADAAVW